MWSTLHNAFRYVEKLKFLSQNQIPATPIQAYFYKAIFIAIQLHDRQCILIYIITDPEKVLSRKDFKQRTGKE